MSRVQRKEAEKESEKWLQRAVNRRQELLDARIVPKLIGPKGIPGPSIKWLSPLQSDGYAEYSDPDVGRLCRKMSNHHVRLILHSAR